MNTAQSNETNMVYRIDVLTSNLNVDTYEIEDSIDVFAPTVEAAEAMMMDFIGSKAESLYPDDFKTFSYELLETGVVYSADALEDLSEGDYFGVMAISYDEFKSEPSQAAQQM